MLPHRRSQSEARSTETPPEKQQIANLRDQVDNLTKQIYNSTLHVGTQTLTAPQKQAWETHISTLNEGKNNCCRKIRELEGQQRARVWACSHFSRNEQSSTSAALPQVSSLSSTLFSSSAAPSNANAMRDVSDDEDTVNSQQKGLGHG